MMKSWLEKDKTKRLSFFRVESCRKVLKAISFNLNLPLSLRCRASLGLSKLPKNSSSTRLKKRCILTGRGRFILSSFNISRLMIRKLASGGFVPGLRKSSW